MPTLPVLVQLSHLRPQGSFHQHVDLPEVRDESTLVIRSKHPPAARTGGWKFPAILVNFCHIGSLVIALWLRINVSGLRVKQVDRRERCWIHCSG